MRIFILVAQSQLGQACGEWLYLHAVLFGGATVRARGDAAMATRVFVRDSVIEGPAPALTPVSIEV